MSWTAPAPAETVLHLAPHPDDEALGACATLLALRDAGWRVVNLACGLGSDPSARATRRAEVTEACRRARFELHVAGSDDVDREVADALARERPALVVSPDPDEIHPAHAAVGRAAERARPARWWTWALWGRLARPTMLVPFGPERLAEILHVLEAHASQLARNDFATLARARAEAAAVLGPELIGGFGSPGISEPYAELLGERA
jgi:LmbE family N-acetylglucosaminyl deacetylase